MREAFTRHPLFTKYVFGKPFYFLDVLHTDDLRFIEMVRLTGKLNEPGWYPSITQRCEENETLVVAARRIIGSMQHEGWRRHVFDVGER